MGELIEIAAEQDIIQKSGSWFSYNGARIGQGREKVKEYLTANKELAAEIEVKVREHMASLNAKPEPAPAAAPAQPAKAAEPAQEVFFSQADDEQDKNIEIVVDDE